MELKIQNKVMIITGGASGIGEAITHAVAGEGAIPVIIDKNEEAGKRIVDELITNNMKSLFISRELNKAESCRESVEETLGEFDRIDALINNAGINDGVGLEHGNPDAFLNSLEKNLYHYYFMAQACLPALKKSRGTIINISSKTAITGQGNTSGYVAAKGAQLGLTREWAAELAKYGIRVNAIIPAEVLTPLYKKWLTESFDDPEKQLAIIKNRIPLYNRLTMPEEVADMAVFLASERASHITGQFIHIDGGYVHLDRAISG
jgi:L-fucose dehydrogenase